MDNVDACDLFGHCVLDLHAGVHFDEVKLAAVHIHQKFDCTRALIVYMRADFAAQLTNFGALLLGEVGRWGALDDFLVAALHRAVALPEVINVTVSVAQDLHLDVAGADDHFLKVTLAVAKGGFGLAAAFHDFFWELFFIENGAHATTAAAPACFEHQGEADLFGLCNDGGHIIAQNFCSRDDGDACLNGDAAGAGFVAQSAHGGGFGADECDACCVAGVNEIGVFREQAIAWVNGVGA